MLTAFTVKRSEWARGKRPAPTSPLATSTSASVYIIIGSALLNNGGKCCLGFACLAAGFTEDEIRDHGLPAAVGEHGPRADLEARRTRLLAELPYLVRQHSQDTKLAAEAAHVNDTKLAAEAAHVNDHAVLTDSARERKITALFAEVGVTVTFED